MASDFKLPIAIFSALVAIIAIPFLVGHIREIRRPVLMEARVVTATPSDPVFRDGRRRVPAGENVEAAVALRFGRRGKPGRWLAPVERLAIEGIESVHENTGAWPDAGRVVRVFWFSVECANLGGRLNAENAADRLKYRTFFAPEMGRSLRAERLPETHNDDHLGQQQATPPDGAGTVRLYARAEIVENDSDLRPIQAITTAGIEAVLDPQFPALLRSADFGHSIDVSVGELFNLPGFEPQSETGAWNEVTIPAFQLSFTDLVSARMVVSSRTFAAVAVSGRPDLDTDGLVSLGRLSVSPDSVVQRGKVLRWGVDVRPGDLLVGGDHWRVLLADEGNGTLDPADYVLHCWGRPPERTTLFASLDSDDLTLEHLRYEP
jgi:hypothetical protein